MFDARGIALAAAGRGPVISAMQEIAKDWAAEEGSFEIGMNRAQCRCLGGLLEIALPEGPGLNQLTTGASGRARLGKARQSANPSGCGSGWEGRKDTTPGISLGCSPSFLRGPRTSTGV